MKTINKRLSQCIWLCTLMLALTLVFSCSPEPDLEAANLEAANAKSNTPILKTLIKGAALKAANGLDVGPDGNIYVASVNGQEIVAMNKNSGKIIRRYGADTGVLGPDDMVFGPDGTFYWTDILTGFVGRKNIDGTTLGYQPVSPGVNPIRFSKPNPDDPESEPRLFVGLDFLGDGIYELDPDLQAPPKPIITCPDGFCLGFFNSFDTRWEDGSLWLYGPLFALNVVIAIEIDAFVPGDYNNPPTQDDLPGALVAGLTDGTIRIVAGDFTGSNLFNPAAAKFGPDGMLYVLDQAGKVFKVNPDGQDDKTEFATLEPGLDNMTFDDDGTLYMTNNDNGWVAEIMPNGQARYLSPGGMILPQGLAVMPGSNNQDRVIVADLFNMREFDGTSGQQEAIFKGFLINSPDLPLPILPMNVSASGEKLVVSSWFSGGVQLWDIGTNPATVMESYVFEVPIDAVQINGDIIVSDLVEGGVVNASQGNALIQSLNVASGLVTDGTTLWAADQATGEIWQIAFDPPSSEVIADGFQGPEGLALDNEGRLLIVEAGNNANQLSRYDFSTGETTVIATGLELYGPGLGSPPTWGFDGVAVGASGDIYISGAGATVVHKITANKVR
ncbi:hypothetical protein ACT6NV_06480 [Robiginitalea sp. IMCC44478]|uniref:hypothetical protein n=1 Tax=Robiginitalea sp. IMCC44478 TaxID=3459122 RepID=UPI004042309B